MSIGKDVERDKGKERERYGESESFLSLGFRILWSAIASVNCEPLVFIKSL